MRRKFSTVVEDGLLRRARLESVRRNKQISEIVAEALEAYLPGTGAATGPGVAVRTSGSIRVGRAAARRILCEEPSLLDS